MGSPSCLCSNRSLLQWAFSYGLVQVVQGVCFVTRVSLFLTDTSARVLTEASLVWTEEAEIESVEVNKLNLHDYRHKV